MSLPSTGPAPRCTVFGWYTLQSLQYLTTENHLQKPDQEVEIIHSVNFLSVSKPQIQEICEETANDPVLQSLKAVILTRWPNQRDSLPTDRDTCTPLLYDKRRVTCSFSRWYNFQGPKVCHPNETELKDQRETPPLPHWHSRMPEKGKGSGLLAQHEQRSPWIYFKVWKLQHLPSCLTERTTTSTVYM